MTPTAVATPESGVLTNPISSAPPQFDPARDLPAGFMDFFLPLHRRFTPRQQQLARKRTDVLQRSLEGEKPRHHFPPETVGNGGRISLPEWCQDNGNQMTGPAYDGDFCLQMW